ncbi:valine--tRNA ligase [Candidatus Lokiarchaeum ossiferum]|uniref:valine--tRNA ligase n=1 Tax=Candidatus Lokiarchaeum ossiferum TaxID=2951803 RepID=UPI00352D5754
MEWIYIKDQKIKEEKKKHNLPLRSSDQFPNRFSFQKIEKNWIKYWSEEEIYKFKIPEKISHKDIFSIDTPPDFTSGNLHMGHILNHSWIDFMARFQRSMGKIVYFPQGFDCHGLPTELKVQKLTGLTPTNDRATFIETCKHYTRKFIDRMREQFDSLGYSTDWDFSYETMSSDYMLSVQKTLIEFYKCGWLYRAKYPVHWCPKCETSLAKQEVGYIESSGFLWQIKLPIKGDSHKKLTIATTRPELIEACIAVLIHPDDWRYTNIENEEIFIPIAERYVPIIKDHAVDMNFGTGVVYCCTFGDEMDIQWQQKYHLPIYQILNPNGTMSSISKFKGLKSLQARYKIINFLEEQGYLGVKEDYPHRIIVHSERSSCNSPIEYLPIPQWFIKIKEFIPEIRKDGHTLNWFPNMSQKLFDWCDNLTWDWVISRQRAFGTPIPFWYCSNLECSYVYVPSIEHLPLDPTKKSCPIDHCPDCGSALTGEKDVCDCWIDSSITPLFISQWGRNDLFFKLIYPITVRPQGYEIIRTWLFYTLFRSKKLSGSKPFQDVMLNGMVAGPDGRKMSKSFGNIVSPDEVFPLYGTDAVRLWAAMGPPGQDYQFKFEWVYRTNPKQKAGKKFNEDQNRLQKGKMSQTEFDAKYMKHFPGIQENGKIINKIWNAYRLIWLIKQSISDQKLQMTSERLHSLDLNYYSLTDIDIFILNNLKKSLEEIESYWKKYQWKQGTSILRNFFKEYFCDQYLEALKYRFNSEHRFEKLSAIRICLFISFQLLKIWGILLPFITEELYSRLFSSWIIPKSIHLELWPFLNYNFSQENIESGQLQLKAIKRIRKAKSQVKYALNEYLEEILIYCPEVEQRRLENNLNPVKNTLNVQKITFLSGSELLNLKKCNVYHPIEDKSSDWIIFIKILD